LVVEVVEVLIFLVVEVLVPGDKDPYPLQVQ
jgi:hypothetical protein